MPWRYGGGRSADIRTRGGPQNRRREYDEPIIDMTCGSSRLRYLRLVGASIIRRGHPLAIGLRRTRVPECRRMAGHYQRTRPPTLDTLETMALIWRHRHSCSVERLQATADRAGVQCPKVDLVVRAGVPSAVPGAPAAPIGWDRGQTRRPRSRHWPVIFASGASYRLQFGAAVLLGRLSGQATPHEPLIGDFWALK